VLVSDHRNHLFPTPFIKTLPPSRLLRPPSPVYLAPESIRDIIRDIREKSEEILWGAIFREAILPGGNFPGGNFPEGNFLGGKYPRGNSPGCNLLGGNSPGGNYLGGILLIAFFF